MKIKSIIILTVLIALGAVSSSSAQNDQSKVDKKIESVGQDEAVKIMSTAIKYFYREEEMADQELNSHLSSSVKIAPAGITSSNIHARPKSVSQSVTNLAEGLSVALKSETRSFREAITCTEYSEGPLKGSMSEKCRFKQKSTDSFVAATIPVIRGSVAHTEVRKWSAPGNGPLGLLKQKFKLERGTNGQWQVTERKESMNVLLNIPNDMLPKN